jgi:uncharacterized protein (TIGR03546 family)
MFVLEFVAKLIKILRSEISPNQISWGFVFGMILGLTPFWSLHNLLVVILIIILKVNLATAIFGFGIFSAIAYLIDPLFHSFGFFLLVDLESLNTFWTWLYNVPILALSKFNNTVVMGSFVSSLILMLPVYLLVKIGVINYREKIDVKIKNWKFIKLIKGTKIYSMYEKIRDLGV